MHITRKDQASSDLYSVLDFKILFGIEIHSGNFFEIMQKLLERNDVFTSETRKSCFRCTWTENKNDVRVKYSFKLNLR